MKFKKLQKCKSKKKSYTLFLIIIIIINIIATKNFATNSTINQTEIYLYSNTNCANFPITFRVVNATQYNNTDKEDIENISSIGIVKYTIYNGPLSTLKILTENRTNIKGYFNFTFNQTNNYLIHLEPLNKNFVEKDIIFKVYDCGIKPGEIKTRYYNKTFLLNDFLVKVIKSEYDVPSAPVSIISNSANNRTNITLKNNINISLENYTLLYNLSISNKVTSLPGKVYIGVPIDNNYNNKYLAFILLRNKLFNIKDTKIYKFLNNNYFSFFYNNTGVYYIFTIKTNTTISSKNNSSTNSSSFNSTENRSTNNLNKINESNLNNSTGKNNTKKNSNLTNNKIKKKSTINSNNIENIDLNALKMQEEYQKKKRILLIVFLLIILMIVVSILIIQNKKAKQKKNRLGKEILPERKDFTTNNKNIDKNLSLITKVRAYVRKYKKDYTKDQIYLALKKSGVPMDIIEKVFKEEF